MKDLKINKKPFSETKHYSGTYICDCSQWEDELQEDVYEFTFIVNIDNENESTSIEEIIWVGKQPRDLDGAEDHVKENFFELIN